MTRTDVATIPKSPESPILSILHTRLHRPRSPSTREYAELRIHGARGAVSRSSNHRGNGAGIMRSRRLGRGVRLAVAVGTALAFACSCTSGATPTTNGGTASSETVFGPSQPLGNG